MECQVYLGNRKTPAVDTMINMRYNISAVYHREMSTAYTSQRRDISFWFVGIPLTIELEAVYKFPVKESSSANGLSAVCGGSFFLWHKY